MALDAEDRVLNDEDRQPVVARQPRKNCNQRLFDDDGRMRLSSARRVGCWRPAVDVLFSSAARVYGAATIGVVLSGMMWDGARGIADVASAGGVTIVQDEESCPFFDMPAAALDLGRADVAMSPRDIARALCVLAGVHASEEVAACV